ncbi:MAG: hypothetical protein KatS3mg026_1329 [Bacteroidia bacterium]|nr:MAG: hypothetical protein KatS3mg026_1329 [Bacteroidia bacterium]
MRRCKIFFERSYNRQLVLPSLMASRLLWLMGGLLAQVWEEQDG